jgi:hypothetical protein
MAATGRLGQPSDPRSSRRGGLAGSPHRLSNLGNFKMEQKLKIAVFIDFDNIEIGVKSTLTSPQCSTR